MACQLLGVQFMKRHPILLCTVLSSLSLFACSHNEHAEGPAERAGEHIDNAAEKTKEGAEKATEKTGDAIGDAGDKVRDVTKDEH
jgi:hypothetical protein